MSRSQAERLRIHGLYAKILTKDEQGEIAKVPLTSIEGEIAYLRSACSRLARIVDENGLKAGDTEPLGDGALRTLRALDRKLNTLLRYIRTQAYLNGERSEYDRQIEEGEFLARKRRNVFNYLSTGKKTPKGHRPSGMGDG